MTLFDRLWASKARTVKALALRARRETDCNPVGDGDAKTASPGTYRPVGETCPPCPMLGAGCYAEEHNVGGHQKRAHDGAQAALASATVAAVAALRSGRHVRLHVSGDFYRDGELDRGYLAGLVALGAEVQAKRTGSWAWTYTHGEGTEISGWVKALAAVGVVVRRSDHFAFGGAVRAPTGDTRVALAWAKSKRLEGVNVRICPAQVGNTDCNRCRICWERPEVVVGFVTHGARAKSRLRVV